MGDEEQDWHFDPPPTDDEPATIVQLGTIVLFRCATKKVKRDPLLVISDVDKLAARVDRRNVVGLVYVDGEVDVVRLAPTTAASAGGWGIEEVPHRLFEDVAPEDLAKMVKRASRSRRRVGPW